MHYGGMLDLITLEVKLQVRTRSSQANRSLAYFTYLQESYPITILHTGRNYDLIDRSNGLMMYFSVVSMIRDR